ncbi:MAG: hypothetical protein WC365_08205 [Candidatus Babeliales bacterium]|jgi:hypothetical protein
MAQNNNEDYSEDYDDYEPQTIRGLLRQYIHRDLQRIKWFFINLRYKLRSEKSKQLFDQKYGVQMFEFLNRSSAIYELLPKQPWNHREIETETKSDD